MDIFFEQLVKIKKTAGTVALAIALYLLALLLVFFMVLLALNKPFFMSFVILLSFFVIWGLSKAVKMLCVEYEYIITNDELDIDRIIGKEKRRRLITFNLRRVEQAGAYNAAAAARLKNQSFGERHLCCNPTDENQLYFITRHAKKGAVLVVIAPNERMAETLERVVPKTVIYR